MVMASSWQVINNGLLNWIYFCAFTLKCALRKQLELGPPVLCTLATILSDAGFGRLCEARAKCKTTDTFVLQQATSWDSLLPSISLKYTFFPTVLVFFLLKHLCRLCLSSVTKKTKLFLGRERLCSLMWCIAFFTKSHYKIPVSRSRDVHSDNASPRISSGGSPCEGIPEW